MPEKFSAERGNFLLSLPVVYNPALSGPAAVWALRSKIEVSAQSQKWSRNETIAILRHEKAHALFDRLPAKLQRYMARFCHNHCYDELTEAYTILRTSPLYSHSFFTLDRTRYEASYYASTGLPSKGIYKANLMNAGNVEDVNLVEVMNEIIAYANNYSDTKDHKNYKNQSWIQMVEASQKVIQKAGPGFGLLLERNGFFHIDVTEELANLYCDPGYQDRKYRSSIVNRVRSTLQLLRPYI